MSSEIGPFRRVNLGTLAEESVLDIWGLPHVGENRWPFSDTFTSLTHKQVYPGWGKSGFTAYFNAMRLFAIDSTRLGKAERSGRDPHTYFISFLERVWFHEFHIPEVARFLNSDALILDDARMERLPLHKMDLLVEGANALLTRPRFNGTRFLPGSYLKNSGLVDPDFRNADIRELDLGGSEITGTPRFSFGTKLSWSRLEAAKDAGDARKAVTSMVTGAMAANLSGRSNVPSWVAIRSGTILPFSPTQSQCISFCTAAGIPWSVMAAQMPAFPKYVI